MGKPDLEEAENAIEEDDDGAVDTATMLSIAMALMDHDPALTSSGPDREAMDRHLREGAEEFSLDQIELNQPEGGIQLSIYNNKVAVSVPYWYSGTAAEAVFEKLNGYTKVIRQTAGYFVYNQQTGDVFDPLVRDIDGLDVYQGMSARVDQMGKAPETVQAKKPWWKFW